MSIALFSTSYIPSISWISSFSLFQDLKIEQYENYKKQTYRNRCHIYSANGLLPLIVPVNKTSGNHTLLKDIAIDYSLNWPINHVRSIEAAYNRTPYYLHYKDFLDVVLQKKHHYLVDLNCELLEAIMKILHLQQTDFQLTERFAKVHENDFRDTIHPKKEILELLTRAEYYQPFSHKYGFIPDLSIIDLIFNLGPDASKYIKNLAPKL